MGPEPKTTVAILGGSLRIGGAEKQIVRLITGLAGGRYRPVLILKRFEGPLAARIDPHRVPVLELGFRSLRTSRGLRAMRRLRRFLEEQEAGILQSYLYGGHLMGAWALHGVSPWRSRPRPHHVICVRSHHLPRPALMKPFYRWVGRRAAAVVGVSDDIRRTALSWGVPESKLRVIPNGVDVPGEPDQSHRARIRAGLGVPGDALLVGMVGNLRKGKGQEDLLRAVSAWTAPGDWRLLLVGDGPMREPLEVEARRTGVADRVVFTGHREDVTSMLPALDVFVYPSHREGMPNALLEAMAAGLPCVASDIPVHRDLLDGGSVGRLVPVASPESIARALEGMGNSLERRALGTAARERVRSAFSMEALLRRYAGLYDTLVGEDVASPDQTAGPPTSHVSPASSSS